MPPTPQQQRPSFSVAWGAAVSLIGFALTALAGAVVLAVGFGLTGLVLSGILAWRALRGWRERLLWRLRNRLLAAYVFIGFIPVLLLLAIGLVAGWTVYGKVAVYLVTDHLGSLQADVHEMARDLATALEVAQTVDGTLRPERVRQIVAVHTAADRQRLPGIQIHLLGSPVPETAPVPAWLRNHEFNGILMSDSAELVASQPVRLPAGSVTVVLFLPLDADVLPLVGRDIGRVALRTLGEAPASGTPVLRTQLVGEHSYPVLQDIKDPRPLPPPFAWWDASLGLAASQPTFKRDTGQPGPPLVLFVNSRVALVHRQLAYRLGEFSGLPFAVFTVFAVLFLLLELVALRIGIRLTRTITQTVNDLQLATEQVQAGNFSHRIRLRGREQLSGLGQAFNDMTASIERLIQESRRRQQLENELEIARQVQEQLFPHEAPRLETLELVGRCRPARGVSGDYYDYGLAEPGKLMFAIGDISGKGISAALLMATIQSILRTQVYASRLDGKLGGLSLAELVTRVNRQLVASTSPEKYSSLFVALYDDGARRLTYVNAGHLPPAVIGRGRLEQLGVGGPVVGLFDEAAYEQASVELAPGNWVVAFTDGLTEVTNSYDEEYGSKRLLAFLERAAAADGSGPDRLAEAVLAEAEQWAPGVELADDCTVLVARVR